MATENGESEFSSKSTSERIRLAQKLGTESEYFGVIEICEALLIENPASVEARFLLGAAHYKLGNSDIAKDAWTAVLRHDPNHNPSRIGLKKIIDKAKERCENLQEDEPLPEREEFSVVGFLRDVIGLILLIVFSGIGLLVALLIIGGMLMNVSDGGDKNSVKNPFKLEANQEVFDYHLREGNWEKIKGYMDKFDVQIQNTRGGYSPLHWAIHHGNPEMVERIIQTYRSQNMSPVDDASFLNAPMDQAPPIRVVQKKRNEYKEGTPEYLNYSKIMSIVNRHSTEISEELQRRRENERRIAEARIREAEQQEQERIARLQREREQARKINASTLRSMAREAVEVCLYLKDAYSIENVEVVNETDDVYIVHVEVNAQNRQGARATGRINVQVNKDTKQVDLVVDTFNSGVLAVTHMYMGR